MVSVPLTMAIGMMAAPVSDSLETHANILAVQQQIAGRYRIDRPAALTNLDLAARVGITGAFNQDPQCT